MANSATRIVFEGKPLDFAMREELRNLILKRGKSFSIAPRTFTAEWANLRAWLSQLLGRDADRADLHRVLSDIFFAREPRMNDSETPGLFSARVMLGFVSGVTEDTPLPGKPAQRFGDALIGAEGDTVASRGEKFRFDLHLLARVAFLLPIADGERANSLRKRETFWDDVAGALAEVLEAYASNAGTAPAARPSGRVLSVDDAAKVLATKLDTPVAYYPEHLTPSKLAGALTLSNAPWRDPLPGHASRLYADTVTRNGAPALQEMASHRRLVLLGNPGGGKSTLLQAHVAHHLRHTTNAIFVRLSDVVEELKKRKGVGVDEAVRILVDSCYSDQDVDQVIRSKIAHNILTDRGSIVALDGLDEVDAERHVVDDLLAALSSFWGRVVVSSRFTAYLRPSGEWSEYSVDELSYQSKIRFLDDWFSDDHPEAKLRARKATVANQQDHITGSPVALGIITWVAAYGEVPSGLSGLYQRFLDLYLRRSWRPDSVSASPDTPHRVPARSDVELDALLEQTRSIALRMSGLSSKARVDGSQWSDKITLRELRRDTKSPPTLKALIETHGLLIPYGFDPSPDYQQYRWFHRTVHEYLVGSQIFDRLEKREKQLLNFAADAAQAPQPWRMPLVFCFLLLSREKQERLLSHLISLRDELDPDGHLDAAIVSLSKLLPLGGAVRRMIAEERISRKQWEHALELAPDRARAALIACVRNGADIGDTRYLSRLDHPKEFVDEYLHACLARHGAGDNESLLLSNALSMLAVHDPNRACNLTAELFDEGRLLELPSIQPESARKISDTSLRRMVSSVLSPEYPHPQLTNLVSLIREFHIDDERLLNDAIFPPDIVEVLLATQPEILPSRRRDPAVVSRLLQGKEGAQLALAAGYATRTSSDDPPSISPWAKVGRAASTRRAHAANRPRLERAARVNRDALRVVLRQEELTPELYLSLLNDSPTTPLGSDEIPAALLYYRTAEDLLSRTTEPQEWSLRWEVSGIVVELLLQSHDEVFERLLEQDPTDWRHIEYVGLYHQGECSVEQIVRLAKWAEGANIPVLASISSASNYESSELLSRLTDSASWAFLGLDRNLDALGSLLSRDGMLPMWRPQLLQFARSREQAIESSAQVGEASGEIEPKVNARRL